LPPITGAVYLTFLIGTFLHFRASNKN